MRDYRWELLSKSKPAGREKIIQILLANRGVVGRGQVTDFFTSKDPLKVAVGEVGIDEDEFKKAVGRINRAIKAKEKIIVYGDYDADGVCATAILWEAIHGIGGKVLPYIPERVNEGYGLNEESIAKLKKEDPQLSLIVTVDHGIVGHKKINFAKELGVEVIVSDHHQPGGKRPEALAVVHTMMLSGAGVAWMVANELGESAEVAREQLGLVALGTIADLVPLTGVNRSLVKEGLKQIRKTRRPGLKALMEIARVDPLRVGTYEVGYIITPRLNAMGRLEHAIDSLRLLCTHDEVKARQLAAVLDQTNRERQLLTEETTLHAKHLLLTKSAGGKRALIFIGHESYQQGVVGLVAGKLVEEYYQPAIVIAKGERYSKASARSIAGFNIIETIRGAEDLLVDVGGHPMAAGFTVETTKLEVLEKKLEELTLAKLGLEVADRVLKIDVAIKLAQVDESLAEELGEFGPFGQGNIEPLFASFGAKVLGARVVGAEGRHLKLMLSDAGSGEEVEAIGFRMGEIYKELTPGCRVDVAYNVAIETWNGNRRLQLRLRDIKVV